MPLKISDFLSILDEIAPVTLAESWDNVGLQLGTPTAALSGVLVALDLTAEVVEYARSKNLNTILVHHPLFFKPVKALDFDSPFAAIVRQAIAANLNIIAAHTNYDAAPEGLNDAVAKALALRGIRPLRCASSGLKDAGMGRIGVLPKDLPLSNFVGQVKEKFSLLGLRWVGGLNKKVKTVALCGGSGAFLIDDARRAGADVFMTGDIKYHDAMDAHLFGPQSMVLLDVGHFALEQFAMGQLSVRLQQLAKKKGWKFSVEFFKQARDPFQFG